MTDEKKKEHVFTAKPKEEKNVPWVIRTKEAIFLLSAEWRIRWK